MTDPRRLFDAWASTYDMDVRVEPDAFPFAGYDAVLDDLVGLVRGAGGARVLELGIGTGALAARIAAAIPGVELWGVDFSPAMLARARAKLPDAHLLEADIDHDFPGLALPPVDTVVAAYVLHELPDDRQLAIVEHLLDDRLPPGGLVAIGDIAFPDAAALAAVRETAATTGWDATEHYVVADAFLARLRERGIAGRFRPVSFCAGVLTCRRDGAARL